MRGSRRSWTRTRAAVAIVIREAHDRHLRPLDDAQERLAQVVLTGLAAQLLGRLGGQDRAVPHEQEPVAVVGLVHHVARDEQAGAAVGEVAESGPQIAPQHGVEADGRFVEHQHGRVVQKRRCERYPRPLPAGEPADDPAREVSQADRRDHGVHPLRRCPEHAGEVAQVLLHRQVAVYRRGLGHVADP